MPLSTADLTRRTVLTTLAAAGAATAAPAAAWSTGTPTLRTAADASPTLVRGATFPEGIMAGVPRTDGATLWTEFRHVVLPLLVGGLASTGLLCLVLSWNEAFWALNLSSAKAGTLATLIASYSSPEGLFWAKLSAASLLAIAPIVVFGWFSQKQLVQGLTFGAVK